jgi:transposase
VSDEEWAFVARYLALLPENASQRRYALREVFNAVRYMVRTGAHWHMMLRDLPLWPLVYQQMRRWLAAGCFETIVHNLRLVLRKQAGRGGQPTATILDSRTLQFTAESGARAGYDGATSPKHCKGFKVHTAIDTVGYLFSSG